MPKERTEQVYVLITIDTECDHDPHWVRSSPLTFTSITEGLPNRLQPAFDSVGAVPTYLLTVEVMEDEESVESLRKLWTALISSAIMHRRSSLKSSKT